MKPLTREPSTWEPSPFRSFRGLFALLAALLIMPLVVVRGLARAMRPGTAAALDATLTAQAVSQRAAALEQRPTRFLSPIY